MTEQKRAMSGGEVGANGEWYPGGAFIATTDHAKSAPYQARPVDVVALAARRAEAEHVAQWLEGRRALLSGIVETLTANPGDVDGATWARRVEDHAAGFLPSLGRTLYMQGTLSARQAEMVVLAVMGRRNRRNEQARARLVELLTESL